MPAKVLIAEDRGTDGYFLRVHLDTDKALGDGSPDPAWTREYSFGRTPPSGVTQAQYRTALFSEVKALVTAELAKLRGASGTVLTGVQDATF